MLKRSALFAIAASALGLAALTPTDASAWHRGGIANRAHFTHVGYRFHPGFYRHPYFGYRANFVRYNWRWGWRPGFCWRHPVYCRARFGVYRYGVAPVVPLAAAVAAPAAAVAVPAVPVGRCLIQRRLADGNSLFRNLCTNEAAITSGVPESDPPPLK
jgi:hypothetical protein